MNKDLEYYKDCFSSLNTKKKCGKPAPHKASLMLSVIDLIERGVITNFRVPLSDDLVRQFKRNTSAANDNVIDNFEQIFKHYSPDTVCKII